MIYEENKTKWQKGDIAIHDNDAKEHKMLMVVLSVDNTGLARTQYFNIRELVPDYIIRKYGSFEKIPFSRLKKYLEVWLNDVKYLHAPIRFGIQITDEDRENARNFMLNKFYHTRGDI
jgi:hypothetical protein